MTAVLGEERTEQLGTGAPTVREAADLIRGSLDLGTVARLDYFHAALQAAYERGRQDEQRGQLWDLQ